MNKTIQDLLNQCTKQINIGTIVSAYDKEHPEYFNELFMVIGFQLNFNGEELVVALMDHEYKTFLVHIDNIILKSLFTIDDMFPPRINNQVVRDTV
jgi:hypothetical protein